MGKFVKSRKIELIRRSAITSLVSLALSGCQAPKPIQIQTTQPSEQKVYQFVPAYGTEVFEHNYSKKEELRGLEPWYGPPPFVQPKPWSGEPPFIKPEPWYDNKKNSN